MTKLLIDTPYQAWVYLNRVVEGPSHVLAALLEEFEPERIAHGIYHRADWLGALRDQTASRWDWLRQEEDMAAAEAVGARLITPGDPQWPEEAFARSFGFYRSGLGDAPANFDADAVAPHSLWVRGGDLAGAVHQAVAVVGTRAISRYGFEVTKLLCSGLVRHQWSIVSGGALGVDTVAHEHTLAEHGTTVAVAACGIDYPYPARNARLFDQIAASGVLVSEFPPGTTPQRHRFLTRNRLVAALTDGAVVVEAAFRSGALNTLNWAEALGKVAMAVPGPITGTGSIGCHRRIQEGRAQLVTSADGIRELLERVGSVDEEAQLELEFAPSATQRLSRNELRAYDATPPDTLASAADIARDAGLPLALTIHLLVAVEKQGLVVRQGGGWCRVPQD
ncbi:DNA-protecting protein DprA [Corynebacterium lizhenjunii]|uniref:DNA-protecting protein DprA n=1 Tax=Corynebacterium lizhenjunii TaxID=2709394 RepID=A0A7T0KCU8_9CORY|nr:DNA-processing protein DprA [Corynebacterium lizhenjunii]QPK78425.1 DNA-protecting protein DprA [Corynebacterium lizhenjunii]